MLDPGDTPSSVAMVTPPVRITAGARVGSAEPRVRGVIDPAHYPAQAATRAEGLIRLPRPTPPRPICRERVPALPASLTRRPAILPVLCARGFEEHERRLSVDHEQAVDHKHGVTSGRRPVHGLRRMPALARSQRSFEHLHSPGAEVAQPRRQFGNWNQRGDRHAAHTVSRDAKRLGRGAGRQHHAQLCVHKQDSARQRLYDCLTR
jgi:hypothetical protein